MMKKLLPLLFILTAFISNAQNNLDKITGLSSTTASVAYSLRQLSSSYTGPLVRIKVGTSFYDVYPDASTNKFSLTSKISTSISTYNAAVSGASANALNTIITGSTDATVAIWYDQSGNGVDVLSNTSTAKIITAGSINTLSGQPTVYFSGNTSKLSSSSTVDYSALSGATVNAVAQNTATTSGYAGIIGTANTGTYPGYNISYSSGGGYQSDGDGCGYGSSVTSTDPKIVTTIFVNNTTNYSKIYVNTVLKTNVAVTSSCALSNTSNSKIFIGVSRGLGSTSTFVGNISEAIIFPSQLNDAVRNPLESNQTQTYFSPAVTIASSASGAVCLGTSVTFTATTYNFSGTPTYQWYKNGTAISGETNATYTSTTLSNNDVIKVSAGDAIVTSSLIQNLDANNATSYSSGNTWTDLTVNGNNGTINTMSSGSVAIATEGTIKSFKYTKGLSYIAAPLSKTASMTFNVWAKTSSLSNYSSGTMLFNAGASGTGALSGGPDLFIAANKIFWNTYDATGNPFKLNGTDITTTTASINDVNWHYFTVVVDAVNNTASLYIDGVFKGVAVYKDPRTYSSTALFIGGEGNNANITNYDLAWDGNISAFQSYSRALSLTEVVQNFNSKAAFFGANSAALNVSNSITASITGSTPTFTITGDGCAYKTTLTTPAGATAYAWYKDDVVIPSATTNTYTPNASGVYKVTVTNGSCSSTSTTTTIYECGRAADGRMVVVVGSTALVSKEGAINNGFGVDDAGKLLAKPWSYVTVTSPYTAKVWMDRNLGAAQAATGVNDVASYGDLYQWGRATDGGQLRTAPQNSTKLTDISSRSTNSISSQPWTSQADWNSQTGGVWNVQPWNNTDGGVNNPCPNGFRVPTASEWNAELNGMIAAGLVTNSSSATNIATGAYASFLKIPQAGVIEGSGFSGTVITNKTVFWTTDRLDSYSAKEIRFWPTQGAYQNANWYSFRYSVRCIAK